MKPRKLPPIASRLLSGTLPASQREFAIGDLEEEFRARAEREGLRRARSWYRVEAARSVGPWLRRLATELRDGAAGYPGRVLRGSLGDFRFALRSTRRHPGTALLVVMTLTVGIGCTTAVFSLVDRVLLRGLPFADSRELVDVWNTYPSWRGHHVLDALWDRIGLSYPEYEAWRAEQRSFEEVAVFEQTSMALTGAGQPTAISIGRTTASLWPMLGATTVAGRVFGAGESGPGAAPVAVLSHAVWQTKWGGDPSVVGRPVRLDGAPYEVIGVLHPEFRFRSVRPGAAEVAIWLPAGGDPIDRDDGNHIYEAIGRLPGGGVTPAVVEETRRLISGGTEPEQRGARLTPRHDEMVGGARAPLTLLLGAVALLMVLACVNVATLLLGRVAERRGEMATRATLGAGSGRLTRQLLAESLVFSAGGVAGGITLALALQRVLVRWAPVELGIPADTALDLRVLSFTIAIGLATSLAFGLLPTAVVRTLDLRSAIGRSPGRTLVGGSRMQRALVAAQFAISVTLLVTTGLLARSLVAELAVDPGFESGGRLRVDVALPEDGYPDGPSRSRFLGEASERLAALPGVVGVSGSSALPFSGLGGSSSFELAGQEVGDDEKKPEAARRSVLPGFHEVLGIPLVAGRGFELADRDGSPEVAIVSEAMEARFWPGGSAIGEAIIRDNRRWEIVGVVGDVLASDLTGAPAATFYTPLLQEEAEIRSRVSLVLHTEADPAALAPGVRAAIWELDSGLPVDRIEPMNLLVSRSVAGQRYRVRLLAAFALTATLLAGIGVFGVTGRSLVSRMREMGVRVALGAEPGRLLLRELRREAVPIAVGVAAGLALALAGTRFVSAFLFGVTPFDPVTYVVAVLGLAAVGFGAAAIAGRRILRVDPAEVLRAE